MDKQSFSLSKSDVDESQLDLSDDSGESIISPGLPSFEALNILEKAIDDGVFEDSDCVDEL